MLIKLVILSVLINGFNFNEYQMIQDLDEYAIPTAPIDYSFNNEYNEMFKKESKIYDEDIQKYHRADRKLTKVDMFPEQCRSKIK